ncbi:uncharacterized protein [Palaemon carinicauda]|uniref:uncharacterized protein n=1 Tax=Palaemon carinicauda TaxID=392227 RepID=UPI0035B5F8A9
MQRISHELSLNINRKKTEMMRTEYAMEDEISLEGERSNEVESFEYLGTMISNVGSLELESNERLKKKADQTMARIRRIWKANCLKLPIKLMLYISLVIPVLLYGHKSWYDSEAISDRFFRFENKALRRI